ncbi:MAG: hypothetical protein IBX60_03860 [Candidatus Aminicenantes bacterium]|nr:hypothetical protein [Candidatus Aminicenantes bacterium]
MSEDLKNKQMELRDLLPMEINGWKVAEEDREFNPETIFDYIDGAGEVYRAYNFEKLLSRHYFKKGQPKIVADVFDMGTSADAFGVFTHDLEGEDLGIGQGSTYNGGLLSFWKDRFFLSLYAEEETAQAKKALIALGKSIADSIPKNGEKPRIVSFLPEEGLLEKSIHYFHNHIILNYHLFVADENILFLDQKTEAALTTYSLQEEKSILLCIIYHDSEKALHAYKSFIQAYMPDASEEGLVKTEDNKWTAAKLQEDLLIVVFNAPTYFSAKEMIQKVLELRNQK